MKVWCLLILALAAWISPTARAQLVVCDSIYMVKQGDSLSKIAIRAYGRTTAYQAIFDYNSGIMTDPNIVPSGVGLYIPCIDGELANSSTNAFSELPPTPKGDMKILTGSEYPPYVDEGLPNGGFSVELVERAMRHEAATEDYRVDVINDWSSHLTPLLADAAYDLAFPWFQPDCSARDLLGESSVWRCDNLHFSEPLHEVVVSFYTRPDIADAITSTEDLHGLRICRPRGYFTHDLEAMGLSSDIYIRVAAANPLDCFEQLAEGNVDIVTVNADTTDKILTELDMHDQSRELMDFASIQTLHVVAMKNDPQARVNLLRLNKGLRALHSSGDYRQIAKTHLR
ncbi:MAG: transporter substrate-binding domain-containing protein [Granulosicoccus sp.]